MVLLSCWNIELMPLVFWGFTIYVGSFLSTIKNVHMQDTLWPV